MDWRLLFDYLKRWYAFRVVLFYSAISIILILQNDPVLYPMMSYITLFVYCLYFMMDITLPGMAKIHRSLPVRREAYIKTIWFEGVLAPVLLASSVYMIGYLLVFFISSNAHILVATFSKCLAAWLIFSSSVFIVMILYRLWVSNMAISILFTIATGAYFSFYISTLKYWDTSLPAIIILSSVGIILTWISYFCAPVLSNPVWASKKSSQSPAAKRDYCQQDLSIGWLDRFQSNPFISVPITSFFLIAFSGFLLQWEPSVYQQGGAVLSFSVVFLSFILMILVFVFRWGAILGSIPVFVSLPISRNRMLWFLVLSPGIVLLPIALAPAIGFQISIEWYFFVYTIALFFNIFFIKWGSAVVAFKLTLICFLLTFGVENEKHFPSLYAVITQARLDIVFLVLMTSLAFVWTRRLIFHGDAPYRKKMVAQIPW